MLFSKDCVNTCDGIPDVTWAIPESYLGILWDDVFQRMIVYKWYIELHLANKAEYVLDENVRDALDTNDGVLGNEDDDRIRANSIPPYGSPDGDEGAVYLVRMMEAMRRDPQLSDEFKASLTILITYFDAANPKKIPVFFLNANGFDYILSEKGIELIVPERPEKDGTEEDFQKHVYDLYAKRKTGSYALLVPPEDGPGYSPAIDHQLKTVRMHAADNNVESLLSNDIVIYSTPQQSGDSGTLPMLLILLLHYVRAILGIDNTFDCETYKILNKNKKNAEDRKKMIYCILESFLKLLFVSDRIALPCYTLNLENTRCWFLSGSVFRRIANEMPRVKARLWLESLGGVNVRRNVYESNADDGCRAMFGQSLEISVLPCTRMYFKGLAEGEGPVPGIPAADYKKNEIYIHNFGLTLPEVEDGPSQKQIYTAWKNGVAANPTFTDSAKTC